MSQVKGLMTCYPNVFVTGGIAVSNTWHLGMFSTVLGSCLPEWRAWPEQAYAAHGLPQSAELTGQVCMQT